MQKQIIELIQLSFATVLYLPVHIFCTFYTGYWFISGPLHWKALLYEVLKAIVQSCQHCCCIRKGLVYVHILNQYNTSSV